MKNFILLLITVLFVSNVNAQIKLNKKLQKYCSSLETEFANISTEKKKELEEVGDYILEKLTANQPASVLYICTHNSRRSHFGQVWLQTASVYYGIDNVRTFSGGTEATAFNPRAAEALKRAGFFVAVSSIGSPDPTSTNYSGNITSNNTPYEIGLGKNYPNMIVYSKKYTDVNNPKTNFLAILVCSEADKTCPNVEGAELRIAMPYDDPKYYDNTPSESQKYDERCKQIARDQFYIMSYVKNKMILHQEKQLK